jgi:hypothetical protein
MGGKAMKEEIARQRKAIEGHRKHIHKLYGMRFLEEDALHNALNHVYDEIDHHLTILYALRFAEKHGLKPVKSKRVIKVRQRCDGKGCSRCEHKSCKG